MKYKDAVSKRLEYIKTQLNNLSRLVEGNKVDNQYISQTVSKLQQEVEGVEDLVNREVESYATLGKGFNNDGTI